MAGEWLWGGLLVGAMVLFAVLLLPVLLNGLRVHRWEGAFLLGLYIGFILWQVAEAKE